MGPNQTHDSPFEAPILSILPRTQSEDSRPIRRRHRKIDHLPTLDISALANQPVFGSDTDSSDQEEDENKKTQAGSCYHIQTLEMIEQIEAVHQLQAQMTPTVHPKEGEYITFPLFLPTRRPHLSMRFHPKAPWEQHLLDSGSFFSLISKDKLEDVEELQDQPFVISPTHIRLQSHSEHPVMVLGTTNLPMYVKDNEGQIRLFTIMPFLVTNDQGKCLLGTSFESSRLGRVGYDIVDQTLTASLLIDKHIVEHEAEHQEMIIALSDLPTPVRDQKLYKILLKDNQQFQPGVSTPTTFRIQPENCKDLPQLANSQVIVSLNHDSFYSPLDYLVDVTQDLEMTIPITNHDQTAMQMGEDFCMGEAEHFPNEDYDVAAVHDFVATILNADSLPFSQIDSCYCQGAGKDKMQVFFADNWGRTEFPYVTASSCTTTHANIKSHLLMGSSRTGYTLFIRNGRLKKKKLKELLKSIQGRPRIDFVIPNREMSATETATITFLHQVSEEAHHDFRVVAYQQNCREHQLLDFPSAPAMVTLFRFANVHREPQVWSKQPKETLHLKFLGGEVLVKTYPGGTAIECIIPDNYRCNQSAIESFIRQFLHAIWVSHPKAKMAILMPDHLSNFALKEALLREAPLAHLTLEAASLTLKKIGLDSPEGQLEVCIDISVVQEITAIEFPSTEPWYQAIHAIEEMFKDIPQNIPDLLTKSGLKKAIKAGETFKATSEFEGFLDNNDEAWNDANIPQGAMDNKSEATDLDTIPFEACLPQIVVPEAGKEHPTHWRQLPWPFPEDMDEETIQYYSELFDKHNASISMWKGHVNCMATIPPLSLDVGDATHSISKTYPISLKLREAAFKIIDDLITSGVAFEVSSSPFTSPLFIIPRTRKTAEMTPEERERKTREDPTSLWRLVCNFSGINSLLKKRDSEIGNIDDIFSNLQGNAFCSAYDLSSYFHGIRLDRKAQVICTMSIAGRLIRPRRLFEGVSQFPAHAAYVINLIRKRSRHLSLAYLDDIFVVAPDKETLRKNTELLFLDLRDCGALLSLGKCQIERTQVDILGHTVTFSADKVATIIPQTARYKIFKEYPKIKSVSALQRFLGLIAYCQSFGENLQFICSPLYGILARHNTLPKNQPVIMTATEERSFDILCKKMSSLEALTIIGPNSTLNIFCDASHYGYGTVVTVTHAGVERIASFHSKRFSDSFVRNNSSGNKETYAVMLSCNKFRKQILQAESVTVHTDCSVLLSLMLRIQAGKSHGSSVETRWLYVIGSYPLTFRHRPRNFMQHADALSKIYQPTPNHDHFVEYRLKHLKAHQVSHALTPGEQYSLNDLTKKVEESGLTLIQEHSEDCQECASPPPGPRVCPDKECVEICEEEQQLDQIVEDLNGLSNWIPACHFLEEYAEGTTHRVQVNSFSPEPLLGYTIPTILDIQAADPETQNIVEILQTEHPPPRRFSRYRLLQNLLLMRLKKKNEPARLQNLAIVLPRPEITRLCFNVHQVTHSPPERLLEMVNRHFHHPQMRKVTKAIANSCLTCLVYKRKTSNDIPQGALPPPKRPMDIIYADYGFFKKTTVNGKVLKYVLIFIDSFSLLTWGLSV
jgi:hypothetical protein